QRISEQIDLSHRQIVGGPPVRIHLGEERQSGLPAFRLHLTDSLSALCHRTGPPLASIPDRGGRQEACLASVGTGLERYPRVRNGSCARHTPPNGRGAESDISNAAFLI